jgi:hypothetical protein
MHGCRRPLGPDPPPNFSNRWFTALSMSVSVSDSFTNTYSAALAGSGYRAWLAFYPTLKLVSRHPRPCGIPPIDDLDKLESVSTHREVVWGPLSRDDTTTPLPALFLDMDFLLNLDFRVICVDRRIGREYGWWRSPRKGVEAQWP